MDRSKVAPIVMIAAQVVAAVAMLAPFTIFKGSTGLLALWINNGYGTIWSVLLWSIPALGVLGLVNAFYAFRNKLPSKALAAASAALSIVGVVALAGQFAQLQFTDLTRLLKTPTPFEWGFFLMLVAAVIALISSIVVWRSPDATMMADAPTADQVDR